MVDAMNYDNFKQTTTHDPKKQIHLIIIEAKYSNKN
jgi:hypothetical protein